MIIFLSLRNPCNFLLVKEKVWKRIFKTNCELSQNDTEKQFMSSKTTVKDAKLTCLGEAWLEQVNEKLAQARTFNIASSFN